MNLGEMRAMVRETVRDNTGHFIEDWELDTWINEAYYDVAARLRTYRKEITELTSGAAQFTSGRLAFPSDLVEVQSLRLGSDTVVWVADDVWNSYVDDAADVLGNSIGTVWLDEFELWPTPEDNASYTLRYAAYPAALAQQDDAPYLPRDMHPKLVNYARSMALMKDHNPYAGNYLDMYERNLPEPPTGVIRTRPGPRSFQMDAGPFDNDWETTHR